MRLYLAYGSNLNKRAMRIRCEDARPVGKIMLTDARLVFRGVADVEYSPGSRVPCGVWSISERDEARLDMYEGVAGGLYYKERGIQIKYKGQVKHPLIYLMTSEGVFPPNQHYVDTIRKGYKDFGLDERYLDEAIKNSFEQKAPDEQTARRRVRQRKDVRTQRLVQMPEEVALNRVKARSPDLFSK